MSDGGRTRLEIDNDLLPQQQPRNALVPWGDPEAYGVAQASKAMEPVVGPYLKDVVTGQAAKKALQERFQPEPAYDPNRSVVEQARERLRSGGISPTAMDLALAFSGGGLQFRAHHGTATKTPFPEFDDAFMGTNTGVQAFSWGHYVATNPKLSGEYVPPPKVTMELAGSPWVHHPNSLDPAHWAQDIALHRLTANEGDVAKTLAAIKTEKEQLIKGPDLESVKQMMGPHLDNAIKFIQENRPIIKANRTPQGQHLDVWIKPDDDEFLNWHNVIPEQPPGVQEKIVNLIQSKWPGVTPDMIQTMQGVDLWRRLLQSNAAKMYPNRWQHILRHGQNTDEFTEVAKATSKELDAAGIPGMKHLDAFSLGKQIELGMDDAGNDVFRIMDKSRVPGQGRKNELLGEYKTEEEAQKAWESMVNYNYAIYDPKNIEITHRDGRLLIPVEHDPFSVPKDRRPSK